MDPRKKQLLIWIGIIVLAFVAGFFVFQAVRLYTPWSFEANVNQPTPENPENQDTWNTLEWNQDGSNENPTEQLSWWNWSIGNNMVDGLMPTGTITVIVPAWVDSAEFKQALLTIEINHGIKTKVSKVNTITEYQQILRAVLQHPEKADIVLVPTNWIESFTNRWYYIPFKNSIAPLFHSLFRTRVDHTWFTYVPYMLDPYVTLYNPASYQPQGKTTFSDVQSALLTPRKSTSGYLPLLFGIDAGDVALLEQWAVPYPWYIELLQLFLNMDIWAETISLLEFFNQTTYRDTVRFHALSTALGERVNSCQYRPQLCLLAYDLSDIGFWRLHEVGVLEDEFPNSRARIEFSNIPTLGESYPVTWRGRVISKQSENIQSSLTRTKWYLEIIVDKEPTLHKTALSATNALYQRQKIENRYLPLSTFESQFELIVWSITDNQKLLQKTALLPMLRGEYSKWIFLKDMIESAQ